MIDVSDLSPRDRKILYAQAHAYVALAAHEHDLFSNVEGENQDSLRAVILADIVGLNQWQINNDEPPDVFIAGVPQKLASSLAPKLGQRSSVGQFLSTMQGNIASGRTLEILIDQWFERTVALGEKYMKQYFAHRDIVPPQLGIVLKIDESLLTPPEGETVSLEGNTDHRNIFISLNPAKFVLETFFAIPALIFHEFWCHCLSDIGQPKSGCDPTAQFEEGWMHYVQSRIFERELDKILPADPNIGVFQSEGSAYTAARSKTSAARLLGYRTAMEFRWLLRTVNSDADGLLIQLSLDLNQAVHPPQFKNRFADRIADLLQTGARDSRPNLSVDEQLVESQSSLAKLVVASIQSSQIDVNVLAKLLKIQG
jgi:hypothetical protein